MGNSGERIDIRSKVQCAPETDSSRKKLPPFDIHRPIDQHQFVIFYTEWKKHKNWVTRVIFVSNRCRSNKINRYLLKGFHIKIGREHHRKCGTANVTLVRRRLQDKTKAIWTYVMDQPTIHLQCDPLAQRIFPRVIYQRHAVAQTQPIRR